MSTTTRRLVATLAIAGATAAGAAAVPLALGSQSAAAGTAPTAPASQQAGEFLCLDLSNLNLPSVCVAGLGGRR